MDHNVRVKLHGVTNNDVKKLEKQFFSFSFLESNKKSNVGLLNRCGGARETIQYFFWGLSHNTLCPLDAMFFDG